MFCETTVILGVHWTVAMYGLLTCRSAVVHCRWTELVPCKHQVVQKATLKYMYLVPHIKPHAFGDQPVRNQLP